VSVSWIRRFWGWVTLTLLRRLIASGVTVVLGAALVFGIYKWSNPSQQCAPGVEHRGPAGECVGVTDGSFVFASQLKLVESAISRENDNLGSGPHATVALLVPFTSPDPTTQTEILHAVQGAYAAQYRANHDDNNLAPPIRLILANPGLNSSQYLPVVQELAGMTGPPDNLRAVVGISVSTDTTKAEVGWLTRHGIPVVGGPITADDIANPLVGEQPFPGLARVEPTNSQEASALAHFGDVNASQALLVEDTRTDDDYITTLANAFAEVISRTPYQPYQFTSPSVESQNGDTSNTFRAMVPNICDTKAKWIYFAGRQVQLRQFINQLAMRGCQNQDFTILTGSAASHLQSDPELDRGAFGRGITLDYAAIASPDAWPQSGAPITGGSPSAYQTFATDLGDGGTAPEGPIGPTGLADGETIINYDAAWTAITGIRDATTQGTPMPSLRDIANGWRLLNGENKVLGASGWICLDNAGNPYDKAVPIVRYITTGIPQFVTDAWPADTPPDTHCLIPKNG
jgi:hypothetical protein